MTFTNMRNQWLAALSLLLLSTGAWGAEFDENLEAARRGDIDAMHHVGAMYANGNTVDQDYAEARKWFERAAYKGRHNSMYSLGIMNQLGEGMEINLVAAHVWYSLAAQHIPKDADEWLIPRAKVAMYERQPGEVAEMLTAEQLREAEKLRAFLSRRIAKRP